MKTAIYKGRDGWKAETQIPLTGDTINEGDQYLNLSTYKSSGKGLVTFASVCTKTDVGFQIALGRDYMKAVTKSPARCTEKSVKLQHEATLDDIDTILADEDVLEAARETTA